MDQTTAPIPPREGTLAVVGHRAMNLPAPADLAAEILGVTR